MALGHLTPGSRGRCVRPNDLAALVEGAPRGAEEEEEKDFLYSDDTVEGPRAPAVSYYDLITNTVL